MNGKMLSAKFSWFLVFTASRYLENERFCPFLPPYLGCFWKCMIHLKILLDDHQLLATVLKVQVCPNRHFKCVPEHWWSCEPKNIFSCVKWRNTIYATFTLFGCSEKKECSTSKLCWTIRLQNRGGGAGGGRKEDKDKGGKTTTVGDGWGEGGVAPPVHSLPTGSSPPHPLQPGGEDPSGGMDRGRHSTSCLWL